METVDGQARTDIKKVTTREQLNDWLKYFGIASLVASVQIGPGTMSSLLFAGSGYGPGLLWLVLLSGVWLAGLTMMAGKITVITGRTTLQVLDDYVFNGWGKLNGWFQVICNFLAVVGVSVGLSDVLRVFFPIFTNMQVTVIILAISLYFLVLRGKFSLIRSILSVIVSLMVLLFLINLFLVRVPFSDVIVGLIPSIPPGSLLAVTGIIGASIGGLPMLFYPYQVKVAGWKKEQMHIMKWDSIIFLGVFFSIVGISVFFAATALYTPGEPPVRAALQAAEALRPIGGNLSTWLFAVGFLAVVWTTAVAPCFGSGYYIADILNFKEKNDESKLLIDGDIHKDNRFKWLVGVTMMGWLLGPSLSNYFSPFILIMMAMGIINLLIPFVIGSLYYISTNAKIMGKGYVLSTFHRFVIIVGFSFSIVGVWSFISFLRQTF